MLTLLPLCVCLSGMGQGMVSFANNSTTLISAGMSATQPSRDLYFFGLFTALPGTTDPRQFIFTGLYATNLVTAGRISRGLNVLVPGWLPGETRWFLVWGWSAEYGHDWNPAWADWNWPHAGYLGHSGIGTGVAGGFDGYENRASLPIFGGPSGISGFNIVWIPEPSAAGLLLLGAALLAVHKRHQKRDRFCHQSVLSPLLSVLTGCDFRPWPWYTWNPLKR